MNETRQRIFNMCVKAKTGHLSSSFSCVEILEVLYESIMKHKPDNPNWEDRDYLILSKGQASPALYTILAMQGYFPLSDLDLFAQKGGRFGVHLQDDIEGVEMTCGSLGMGFGFASGIATALKLNRKHNMVYCLLGDGECYEGSIWETAGFVSHNRLNNLVTIVDRNSMCATDWTENILGLEDLAEKFKAFGFNTERIDGHDKKKLEETIRRTRSRYSNKPTAIICDTIKGFGYDDFCFNPLTHGIAPKGEC